MIPVKNHTKPEYVYTKPPWKIFVTDRTPKIKEEGEHIDTLRPLQKEYVEKYIKEKGFTIKELKENYNKRDEINIKYYLDLEKTLPKWPWPFKHAKRTFGF